MSLLRSSDSITPSLLTMISARDPVSMKFDKPPNLDSMEAKRLRKAVEDAADVPLLEIMFMVSLLP